jgi:hypothetical protein
MRGLFGLSIAGILAAVLLVAGVTAAADVQIPLTIENNQFQPAEVKVKANTPFMLVVTNKNPKAAEFESKDLRVEKVVPAGKTVNVRIRALKPGTYAFFDDFNQATTGRIVAE